MKLLTPLASAFREVFLAATADAGDHALCLSGGVDSATVLAAALALGRKPDCYTFSFGPKPSEDNVVAASMARAFGVKLHRSVLPTSLEGIEADVRAVLDVIQVPTKTHVQCSIPFRHMAQAMAGDGHGTALIGMAADDLWGSGRKGSIANREGRDAFRAHRLKDFTDPTASDRSIMKLTRSLGVELVDVWRDQRVADFMLRLDWQDMHAPKDKYLALRAFPEFWSCGAWHRPNKSLQVVSGLRDAHESLLTSPLNKTGRKAVRGIYADMLKGIA